MDKISAWAARGLDDLDQVGAWIGLLGILLLLAWEFGVAGAKELRGENSFAEIQADLPFPLSVVSVDINWLLATWSELLGAAALIVVLGARFWAVGLLVLDVVAWAAVHAGNGDKVCDNGWKLPLICLVLLSRWC